MDCSKAYEYFMKHIDNCLSDMQSEWLDQHLIKCEKCREDFMAYEAVMSAVSSDEEVECPFDLEIKIMEQIKATPSHENAQEVARQGVSRVPMRLSVAFAVVMLLLPVVFMYLDAIMESLVYLREEAYDIYAELLAPSLYYVQIFMSSVVAGAEMAFAAVDMLFDRLRYVILLATAGLVFAQLTLWKRDGVLR